jgi:hypothetical protein
MNKEKTGVLALIVAGVIGISGAAILSYYNGKEKSRELLSDERDNQTTRVVYKIERYLLKPCYEIRVSKDGQENTIQSDDPNTGRTECDFNEKDPSYHKVK